MNFYGKVSGVAAGLLFAGVTSASAALLDFTANGSLSGTLANGIGYTVTGTPVAPNQDQAFDGNAANVLAPLALENDGIGIDDDEVAFSQSIIITFTAPVKITKAYFLDLFQTPGGSAEEVADISVNGGGVNYTVGAIEPYTPGGTGYAELTFSPAAFGSMFTFTAESTNDDEGDPDYALAGLEVAAIPLPAGVLLMGTALAGFGLVRRRKS